MNIHQLSQQQFSTTQTVLHYKIPYILRPIMSYHQVKLLKKLQRKTELTFKDISLLRIIVILMKLTTIINWPEVVKHFINMTAFCKTDRQTDRKTELHQYQFSLPLYIFVTASPAKMAF